MMAGIPTFIVNTFFPIHLSIHHGYIHPSLFLILKYDYSQSVPFGLIVYFIMMVKKLTSVIHTSHSS